MRHSLEPTKEQLEAYYEKVEELKRQLQANAKPTKKQLEAYHNNLDEIRDQLEKQMMADFYSSSGVSGRRI